MHSPSEDLLDPVRGAPWQNRQRYMRANEAAGMLQEAALQQPKSAWQEHRGENDEIHTNGFAWHLSVASSKKKMDTSKYYYHAVCNFRSIKWFGPQVKKTVS